LSSDVGFVEPFFFCANAPPAQANASATPSAAKRVVLI
jgi:hypothetical protein